MSTREPGGSEVRAGYTVARVAWLYEVSESHIRRLIRNGTLQRIPHMGANVRIRPDELERVFGPLPEGLA